MRLQIIFVVVLLIPAYTYPQSFVFEQSGSPSDQCPSPNMIEVMKNLWINGKKEESIRNTSRDKREYGFSIYQCRKNTENGLVYDYAIGNGVLDGTSGLTITLPGQRPNEEEFGECRIVGNHHVHPRWTIEPSNSLSHISAKDRESSFLSGLPASVNRTVYAVQIENPSWWRFFVTFFGLIDVGKYITGTSYVANKLDWLCPVSITTGKDEFTVTHPRGIQSAVIIGRLDPGWVTPALGDWIGVDGSTFHPEGTYTYRKQFTLYEPVSEMRGFWASDDGIRVTINGKAILSQGGVSAETHNKIHSFVLNNINHVFNPVGGTNFLKIEVDNAFGPTGLLFSAEFLQGALEM